MPEGALVPRYLRRAAGTSKHCGLSSGHCECYHHAPSSSIRQHPVKLTPARATGHQAVRSSAPLAMVTNPITVSETRCLPEQIAIMPLPRRVPLSPLLASTAALTVSIGILAATSRLTVGYHFVSDKLYADTS